MAQIIPYIDLSRGNPSKKSDCHTLAKANFVQNYKVAFSIVRVKMW